MTNPLLYFMQLLLVRPTLTADAPSKLMDFTDSALIYLGDCAEEASLALNFWTPPPSSTDAFISSPASRHSFSGHVGWPPVTAMTNQLLYFMQVSSKHSSVKTSDPCFIQLTCPTSICMCYLYVRNTVLSLLKLCGDIESDPGPSTEQLLKELLEGQKDYA
ncbi:hypothetical protein MTO96_030606 [Rhipicephalus appendiculatus]